VKINVSSGLDRKSVYIIASFIFVSIEAFFLII